jgi:GAF domain-containing protein
MKFLRDRSFRQIGAYLLILMFVIYFTEYFIIRYKINVLDEVEQKLDFTRSTQLTSQQISLLVQRYLSGDTSVAVDIEARILQQDHFLEVLGNGGRIDGTDVMLKPLSRLPRISYDNLVDYWEQYKLSVSTLLTGQKDTLGGLKTPPPEVAQDSTTAYYAPMPVVKVPNPAFEKAKLKQDGLWQTLSYWYDVLFNDLESDVDARKASVNSWVIAIIIFDLVLLGLLFYCFDRYVLSPVKRLEKSTADHEQLSDIPKNELGKLSLQINETLESLKDATDFVTAISEGNLDMNYKETLDSGYVLGKNKLADSLIGMQGKLKTMNEEERKRQWANEGLTKFVEIVRSNSSLTELSDKITSALVKYTHSNQGGLYILNDDDPNQKYLELISLFAFDVKKHDQQKIKLGQGILGQTFLEKETTYLKEIPEAYVRITSGLGDATPKAILMVPLKVDKEVYGIVELASFNEYEEYEISFVERLGETIASTIASVRAAQKNRALIEQFQQQTEEMRAQEEEMRQNMEELQATQEEIARKERSYIARIQELEHQASNGASTEETEALKADFARREHEHMSRVQELEKQLSQLPAKGDDWQLAEEMEKTLSIHLEALKITGEELNRKAKGS